MEPIDAYDRIDLVAIAAAQALCPHEDEGTCPDCAVSIVARLWEAVTCLQTARRPIPLDAVRDALGAPHEQ